MKIALSFNRLVLGYHALQDTAYCLTNELEPQAYLVHGHGLFPGLLFYAGEGFVIEIAFWDVDDPRQSNLTAGVY